MIGKRLPILLILTLVLGTALYMVGCGDYESPLSSDLSYTDSGTGLPPIDGVNILPREKWSGDYELMPGDGDWTGYASAIMDRRGGYLSLEYVELDIPNNAIPRSEEIEVSITIPDPSLYLFILGPNGYVFQKDITLRVYLDNADLAGVDPASLEIITYDEASGQWVSEGGVYQEKDNYIEARIDHFSYWALAGD